MASEVSGSGRHAHSLLHLLILPALPCQPLLAAEHLHGGDCVQLKQLERYE